MTENGSPRSNVQGPTGASGAEPPLIGGGQGRTPEEVEEVVRAALPVLAVLAVGLILYALVAWWRGSH